MKEADLALELLRQGHPSLGAAHLEEDTGAPGSRKHHFHFNLTERTEPAAYDVNNFMGKFIEYMEEAGFVPRRLYTDCEVADGVCFTLVLTSAGHGKAAPQWALELEGYVPDRSHGYGNPENYPADLEGSIIEGEEAVRELLAKHHNARMSEKARKVINVVKSEGGLTREGMTELYRAILKEDPDGFLSVWRNEMEAESLEEKTAEPGSASPRPRF